MDRLRCNADANQHVALLEREAPVELFFAAFVVRLKSCHPVFQVRSRRPVVIQSGDSVTKKSGSGEGS